MEKEKAKGGLRCYWNTEEESEEKHGSRTTCVANLRKKILRKVVGSSATVKIRGATAAYRKRGDLQTDTTGVRERF